MGRLKNKMNQMKQTKEVKSDLMKRVTALKQNKKSTNTKLIKRNINSNYSKKESTKERKTRKLKSKVNNNNDVMCIGIRKKGGLLNLDIGDNKNTKFEDFDQDFWEQAIQQSQL